MRRPEGLGDSPLEVVLVVGDQVLAAGGTAVGTANTLASAELYTP